MKILVTGGAGFIGSNLADELIEKGHDVAVIDNLYNGRRENVNPEAKFYEVDIRDKKIEEIFKENSFDAVCHLAAQMDVRKSLEDPFFDADVNIMGGLNLLQNSVRTGVKRFIFASSGGVMYGECPEERPKETKYPMPVCPYGNSKLAFESYLNTYKENYGLQTVALRFGNVYGPRQDPHGEAGVVAIFTGAMLQGKPVKIFGDGEQLRDYVFVKDVVSACMQALEKGEGVYNIGTGESESVNELFEILKNITGYDKEPVYEAARQGELQASRLDVSKAISELNWKPAVDFKKGLEETVEYFRRKK